MFETYRSTYSIGGTDLLIGLWRIVIKLVEVKAQKWENKS
jgi:hypothetical protein